MTDDNIETVEPIMTAELQVERRIDSLIRELDELCAMATKDETVHLLEEHKHSIGLAVTRTQLLMNFLLARKPAGLRLPGEHTYRNAKARIVQNG